MLKIKPHMLAGQHALCVQIVHVAAAVDPEKACRIRRHQLTDQRQQTRHQGFSRQPQAAKLTDLRPQRGLLHAAAVLRSSRRRTGTGLLKPRNVISPRSSPLKSVSMAANSRCDISTSPETACAHKRGTRLVTVPIAA